MKTSRSPVTESNRRPSPYHAYGFRLTPSGWVGLPQVGGIAASGYVALRLPLAEAVVTWFVTGLRISFRISVSLTSSSQRHVGRGVLPHHEVSLATLNLKDYEDFKEHHGLRILGAE